MVNGIIKATIERNGFPLQLKEMEKRASKSFDEKYSKTLFVTRVYVHFMVTGPNVTSVAIWIFNEFVRIEIC